jgi:3'-phosphoadenosine 5'-phosphosulfate sulfotransferase (PAPS reductase)/FAD synthetase
METLHYVIFASGGNDSVALIQWAYEKGLQEVAIAYSNTGWASPEWPARINELKFWVEDIGYSFYEIPSEGMEALIRRKKGWPANRPKFCTYELKIAPAKAWLDTIDPERNAICMVGIRREESSARREWPEYIESSENHGGRTLWAPLYKHTEAQRNELLAISEWEVLPHRSKECSPCVNANRTDFRHLSESDIEKVRRNEQETGRNMFRPHRFKGASGIDEVMKWAWSDRGKYQPACSGCDSGMCGD